MDKFPNDWFEVVVITICIVAIAGGAVAMYSLAQQA